MARRGAMTAAHTRGLGKADMYSPFTKGAEVVGSATPADLMPLLYSSEEIVSAHTNPYNP